MGSAYLGDSTHSVNFQKFNFSQERFQHILLGERKRKCEFGHSRGSRKRETCQCCPCPETLHRDLAPADCSQWDIHPRTSGIPELRPPHWVHGTVGRFRGLSTQFLLLCCWLNYWAFSYCMLLSATTKDLLWAENALRNRPGSVGKGETTNSPTFMGLHHFMKQKEVSSSLPGQWEKTLKLKDPA